MPHPGGLYSNLFITDGTEAGTVEATIDEYSASFASLISMPFGNHMIVANSIGDNVYFSDGTATGEVAIIDDFDYTFDYGFNGKNSFTIGSNLYFWAARTADAEGGELYKTDGTAAGTGLFKAFNPGSAKGFTGSTIGQHHLLQTPAMVAQVHPQQEEHLTIPISGAMHLRAIKLRMSRLEHIR